MASTIGGANKGPGETRAHAYGKNIKKKISSNCGKRTKRERSGVQVMPEGELQVQQEDERRRPALISVYVQKSKKHEPPFYVGISAMDLTGTHVAQIMRVNLDDLISAQVVQRKGEETHWLLIVK
jgi:hypothetical protein